MKINDGEREGIKNLVSDARAGFAKGVGKKEVDGFKIRLKSIRSVFVYDDERYPNLAHRGEYVARRSDYPVSLAEAYIWKRGDWKKYRNFCEYYSMEGAPDKERSAPVFFYFARHLADKNNAIYDQHGLRAAWALSSGTVPDMEEKLKEALLTREKKWQKSGKAKAMHECHEFYVEFIDSIVKKSAPLTREELDHFLMPLGKAIKILTKSYSDFVCIRGWSE